MLLDEIGALGGECYPFHMPAHKRRLVPHPALEDWYALDLTEIEGADDLHDASGILQRAMDRTASLWGSRRTWYLVGGSTAGILAAVRGLAPAGSRIIAAANCHRSVRHAVELGMLLPNWLMPPRIGEYGIWGSVTPQQVEEALREVPDCRAVVITSPTYEGVLSDIRGIADVCHTAGVPLFVDEAHGAHLGLFPGFPASALHLGADVVVQSVHKTLPAPTQTALLHLGREALPCVSEREIGRQLDVFETSSPSYPMMGALDAVTRLLEERGDELFRRWSEGLAILDRQTASLKRLRILCHGRDRAEMHPEICAFDPGKILVSCRGTGLTGPQLKEILHARFGMEAEMAQADTVLLMSGCGDGEEAYSGLAQSLCLLDEELTQAAESASTSRPDGLRCDDLRSDDSSRPVYPRPEVVLRPGEAVLMPSACVPRGEAAGAVCGEYVYAYPPGIPLLAPGERITEEILRLIDGEESSGIVLHCSVSGPGRRLCILTKVAPSMYHGEETEG